MICGDLRESRKRWWKASSLPRLRSVLLESARIYNFKGISRVTGSSLAQPKCQNTLLSKNLRRSEYASSNQVVGSSTVWP
jgi:hypothetical protein